MGIGVAVAATVGVGVCGAGAGDAHAGRKIVANRIKKRNVFFDMNAPEFGIWILGIESTWYYTDFPRIVKSGCKLCAHTI